MAMIPVILFELLPIFGFILCATTSFYLWVMRKRRKDELCALYSMQMMDLLLGLSLFYAGFHGCFVSANTDENTRSTLIDCLPRALHISVWCWLDMSTLAMLLILCFDRVVSIVWSKKHKSVCSIYLNPTFLFLVFCACGCILKPAWDLPMEVSNNATITISPFCSMSSTFGDEFYRLELLCRQFAPLIGIGLLLIVAIMLLVFQLMQDWNFKWSDSNDDSERMYFFVLSRCVMHLIVVHGPFYVFLNGFEVVQPEAEITLRMSYSLLIGLTEPLVTFRLFPEYRTEVLKFFLRYSQNTKRNWQSADDPPETDKNVGGVVVDFGSWYSSAGNIIGEAGVPYEINADKQRSVSFYYNDLQ